MTQPTTAAPNDAGTFTFAGDASLTLAVRTTPSGGRVLAFDAPREGLYQFSLFLEAKDFDWESLYQVLNQYGNVNARTGPWDFRLADAAPLVPSYWIWLDGKRLGLWYAMRVTLEDIEGKRFRGRLAFDVRSPGKHELTLEPFNASAKLPWLSAIIEPDPVDTLDPLPAMTGDARTLPFAKWSDDTFWADCKRKLDTTHAVYREPMARVCEWATKQTEPWAELIAPLIAAHHLEGRAGALDRAIAIVDHWVSRPAWGREREDVYGHNGDIGGGATMRAMAWAYHSLAMHLGDERRKKLLDKLVYQGDAFLTQTLLMRDYWGGSLLQDHGRQAVADLGTAAMHLWGVTSAAERWVSFAVPRLRRALDAAPPDGVIPGSSYYALFMYTHNFMYYRDALLARTGLDIVDHPSLRNVPSYVAKTLHTGLHAMLIAEAGQAPLVGGQALMATLAAKFRDGDAARVHGELLKKPAMEFYHGGQMVGYYLGMLFGFFAYQPEIERNVPLSPPQPRRNVVSYVDAGVAHFRDDDSGAVLAVKCAPWLGYHAYRHAGGPCDRMESTVGAGHFVFLLDGEAILCSPDNGYSLRSITRSCLLVDDHGQIGDAGYPMSIPHLAHRGEEIEAVRWNPRDGSGVIRLGLTRCYPHAAGVAHYTRQFVIPSADVNARSIVVRDHVVLGRPRKLSWLFQHKKSTGCTLEGVIAILGQSRKLRISPTTSVPSLTASVAHTPVVWSYASASGFKPFEHVRYDTSGAVQEIVVDFVLSW